jgi:hypothetical protein
VPDEDFNNLVDVGQVFVFHGSANGLAFNRAWDGRDVSFTEGAADQFGFALVWADFDGDTAGDLAIGIPGASNVFLAIDGLVQVLYGGLQGLRVQAEHVIRSCDHCPFGTVLSAGDYDADGFDDLAVGMPEYELAFDAAAGRVHVMFGTAVGLVQNPVLLGGVLLDQGSSAEANDQFGAALASTRGSEGSGGSWVQEVWFRARPNLVEPNLLNP